MAAKEYKSDEEEMDLEEETSEEVGEEKEKTEKTDEFDYKDIKDLPGVGSTIASKIRSAGYQDIISLATANPMDIAEVCAIGEPTARKIVSEAREAAKMNFLSGLAITWLVIYTAILNLSASLCKL